MAGLQQAARRGHGPSIVTKPLPNIQQVNRVLKRICCGIGQGCPWRIGPAIVSERPLTLPLLALHAHPARRRFRQLPPPHSPANSSGKESNSALAMRGREGWCGGGRGGGGRTRPPNVGADYAPQMWRQNSHPQARVSIPLLELEKTRCGGRLLTHFPGSEAKKKKDCTEKRKSDVGGNYCFSKCVGKLLHFLGYRYP